MTTRFSEHLRALLCAGAVLGAATSSVACGGDDDASSSSSSSSGNTNDGGGNVPPTPTGTGTNPQPPNPPPAEKAAMPTFDPPAGDFTAPINPGVDIKTTTAGATIYYTTNGTNPNTGSLVYNGTKIPVNETAHIRAMAVAANFANSDVADGVFTITTAPGATKNVTFSPEGGGATVNNNAVNVSLFSEDGATICYTVDGNDPGACGAGATCPTGSATYNGASPVVIQTEGDSIHARACKVGKTDSPPGTSGAYHFQAAAPKSNVAPNTAQGTVNTIASGTQVDLFTTTNGGTVHYTTDAQPAPTCTTGTVITNAGATAAITKNTVIHAIACKLNYQDSAVVNFDVRVRAGAPTLSLSDTTSALAGGNFPDDLTVTVTLGSAAQTSCYTLNGTAPHCTADGASGTCSNGSTPIVGNGDVDLITADTTLTVVNCAGDHDESTPATTASYAFRSATPSVHIDDDNTTYNTTNINQLDTNFANGAGLTFDLSTLTATHTGAKICYRTDGQSPSCTEAAGVVTCGGGDTTANTTQNNIGATAPFTLKALACAPGRPNSDTRIVVVSKEKVIVTSNFPTNSTFDNDTEITLAADPGDSTICYHLGAPADAAPTCGVDVDGNGTATCTGGDTYTAGTSHINITANAQWLKAIGCRAGTNNDGNMSIDGPYFLKVATPNGMLPSTGLQPEEQGKSMVVFSNTAGSTIHYTVGLGAGVFTTPTCSTGTTGPGDGAGTPYVIDGSFGQTQNVTWIACKAGYQVSDPITRSYVIGGLGKPTTSPSGSTAPGGHTVFSNTPSITLDTVSRNLPGATICYTIDGSAPSCAVGSNVCVGATTVTVAPGGTVLIPSTPASTDAVREFTLNAITCATGKTQSDTTTEGYRSTTSELTADVTGAQPGPQTVTLRQKQAGFPDFTGITPTAGATICWANNTTPQFDHTTCTSTNVSTTCTAGASTTLPVYNAASTTVNYVSCKTGYFDTLSDPAHGTPYKVDVKANAYSHTITIDGAKDFVAADSIGATDGNYQAWISWDSASFYFGFAGDAVGQISANNYVHWYFMYDKATSSLTGPTSPVDGTNVQDDLGGGQFGAVGLPTNFSHHIYWSTNQATKAVRRWNNQSGAWQASAVNASNIVGIGGAGTTAYVEMAVSRTEAELSGFVHTAGDNLSNGLQSTVAVGGVNAGATVVSAPGGGSVWTHYKQLNFASFNPASLQPTLP